MLFARLVSRGVAHVEADMPASLGISLTRGQNVDWTAHSLLAGAARATAAGSKSLSMRAIQAEVNTVRRERRARIAAT